MSDDPRVRRSRSRSAILWVIAVFAVAGSVALFYWARDQVEESTPPPTIEFGSIDFDPPDFTGDPAADFTVELLDGRSFTLSVHLAEDGRPVFLNFWASWCIPCRREFPAIDAAALRHPGVLFMGIAVRDDPVEAESFAAEMDVSFALAIDETQRVETAYPSFGLPVSFLISPEGMILQQIFGEVDGDQIDATIGSFFGG